MRYLYVYIYICICQYICIYIEYPGGHWAGPGWASDKTSKYMSNSDDRMRTPASQDNQHVYIFNNAPLPAETIQ